MPGTLVISTVSNVINGYDNVTKQTRDKVEAAVNKLKHKPNVIARGLKTKRTRVIGLIIPTVDNSFYSSVVRGQKMRLTKKNIVYFYLIHIEIQKKRLNIFRY